MNSVEVIYGFHESGHYSVAKAIESAIEEQGVDCGVSKIFTSNSQNWGTLFTSFRSINSQETLNFPDFFGSPEMLDEMALEVRKKCLEISADVIVSTHPYTSYALAASIPAGKAKIYDVHTNYTPGPIFPHPRMDGYFSCFPKRELALAYRNKIVECMVPVPANLVASSLPKFRKNEWLFALGADGWGSMADFEVVASAASSDTIIKVLAGRSYPSVVKRVPGSFKNTQILPYIADIGEHLKRSRFVFTKASGSTVTEAVANECVPIYVRSFVPWEIEAARHLVEAGVGLYLDDFLWLASRIDEQSIWERYCSRAVNFRTQILSSAVTIAETVLGGELKVQSQLLTNPQIPTPENDRLGRVLQRKITEWCADDH